jgi:hypothetical protein
MYPNVEKRDTTKALWERLYLVRLPRLEVASVQYLQTYGTYITGDKLIDQHCSESPHHYHEAHP